MLLLIYSMKKTALKIILAILPLFLLSNKVSLAFFPGATFDERKESYIADQGRKWGAGDLMKGVWAWLEGERRGLPDPMLGGKTRKQLISEAVDFIIGPGWYTGALPGPNSAGRMYYGYYQDPATRIISDADGEKLRQKLNEIGIGPANGRIDSSWCAVANWHWPPLVGTYLYNSKVQNLGQLQYPTPDPEYHCPPSFSYNGHSYIGGNYYDAKTLLRDYLEYEMDDMLRNGTEEDLSSAYYWYQVHAIALLYDFAPDASIRQKAKMLMDWLVFHYSVGVSVNHLAGGHGRQYTQFERGDDAFPVGILFNLEPDTMTRWSVVTDLYVSGYRVPQYALDFFESISGSTRNEPDSYYRIIRGRNSSLGNRYDYITPLYNLGGTKLGTGWELNVAGGSSGPLKTFYCNNPFAPPDDNNHGEWCNAPCAYRRDDGSCWMWYLLGEGQNGTQYRNALFSAGTPYIHELLYGQNWDESSGESGWQFRRKGNIAVAMQTSDSGAIEVATLGVDYGDYGSFKNAVKSNALRNSSSFRTSKGTTISDGFVDGSLPFDRLEVWEGNVGGSERKSVDWNNNVMTVSKNGRTCTYDFNSWNYSGDCGGGGGGGSTPTPWPTSTPYPTNTPQPTPTLTPGDFDRDRDVDIFDYNILVENFGATNCGNIADIDGNCKVDIFDYNQVVENFGRKVSPTPTSQNTPTLSPQPTQPPGGGVDLTADDIWWNPDPVSSGNNVTIGFRVKNIGSQTSGSFHLKIDKNSQTICTWDVPSLNSGSTFDRGPGIPGSSCSGNYGVPNAQPPGYTLKLMVDDLNQAAESNEGNNMMVKFMGVQ